MQRISYSTHKGVGTTQKGVEKIKIRDNILGSGQFASLAFIEPLSILPHYAHFPQTLAPGSSSASRRSIPLPRRSSKECVDFLQRQTQTMENTYPSLYDWCGWDSNFMGISHQIVSTLKFSASFRPSKNGEGSESPKVILKDAFNPTSPDGQNITHQVSSSSYGISFVCFLSGEVQKARTQRTPSP